MNVAAVASFALFIALTLAITGWASRRMTSRAAFYVAGSSVSGVQNGFALAGDFLSASAFLGVAGLYFTAGFDGFVYGIGAIIGWPVLLYVMADPLRKLGRFTLTDALVATKLRERPVRLFAACANLTVLVFYMMAQMVGAGLMINLLFGLDFVWAAILVGALMTIYVVFGGMVATTWVQIVKASLLILAAIALAALVLARFDFSFSRLFAAATAAHAEGRAIMGPTGLIGGLGSALSLALTLMFGPAGLPHVLMRFFTVPNEREARRSAYVATLVIGGFTLLMIVIGFGTIAVLARDPAYVTAPGQLRGGSNMAALHLAHALGGNLFLGVTAAVAFCTILAVVSGLTLAAAATVSHDLYATLVGHEARNDAAEIRISRITAAIFAVICIALSVVFQDANVTILAVFANSIAASATFPVLILALFWRPLTTAGAVAGGTAGLVAAVTALILGPGVWTAALHFSAPIFPYQYPTVVAMPLAFITGIIVSLLDRRARA